MMEEDRMLLKAVYQDQSEIPADYIALYEQRTDDGPWELTQVEGVKTQQDVNRVLEALRKERHDHGETRTRHTGLATLLGDDASPETLQTLIDERDDLRTRLEAAEGDSGPTEEQIQELVQRRMTVELRPVKRELEQVTQERDTLLSETTEWRAKDVRAYIAADIEAATQGEKGVKLNDGALEFVIERGLKVLERDEAGNVVTRDNVGVTPGLNSREWLMELRDGGRHNILFPGHTGAGARDGGGGAGGGAGGADNPFKKDNFNLTKIGQLIESDPARAKRLAQAAGVKDADMRKFGL